MKAKENEFRNMVDDPYLYKDCCGGVTVGADGSVDVIKEKTLQNKAMAVIAGIVVLVGIVVTSNWVYNKWIK